MTKFEENLMNAFFDSCYELCEENRKNDITYIKLDKEYDKLFEHIRDLLGKDRKKC